MRISVPIAVFPVLLILSLASCAVPDERTQLERLIGLSPEEAGRYSDGQLALMKYLLDRKDLGDGRRQYLIDEVRAGRKPRFFMIEF